MHITPTQRTIIEYSLTLSAEDAQLALADPFSFGEKIREQLLPHLPGAADQPKRQKPKASQQISLGRRNGHRRAAPKARAAKPAGNSLERIACPECGEKKARKYLPLHRRKAQGVDSTPTSSADAVASATT